MNNNLSIIREKLSSLQFSQLLIPVAIVLMLIVGGKWGVQKWNSQQETIQELIELRELQLAKYTRIANNSANYESSNRELQKLQLNLQQRRLFNSETESIAQAKFQNVIKELAAKNKIDIRSTKVLSSRTEDSLVLIHLRIDAKAEIGDIRDFLLDLRGNNHYIFVPDFEIRTINNRDQRYYYLTAGLVAIQAI